MSGRESTGIEFPPNPYVSRVWPLSGIGLGSYIMRPSVLPRQSTL
jgi:hypothetical protein